MKSQMVDPTLTEAVLNSTGVLDHRLSRCCAWIPQYFQFEFPDRLSRCCAWIPQYFHFCFAGSDGDRLNSTMSFLFPGIFLFIFLIRLSRILAWFPQYSIFRTIVSWILVLTKIHTPNQKFFESGSHGVCLNSTKTTKLLQRVNPFVMGMLG